MAKSKRYKTADEIKVGVIGYGGAFNMGKQHLEQMKQAGMTPVAVTEIDESRLAVASTDFPGIQTYTKVADMLKKSDVNLITIITPHNTHAKLALQCLHAGRHVVCEKPLAITTAECDKMIAAAKKNGVVLSTYHNRHWDGWIMQAVKEVVEQKAIGEVVRVEARMGGYSKPGDWWRTSKTVSGGILYDWGVHLLEYTLQLIDSEIVEVSGYAHKGFWGPQTKWGTDANEDEGYAVVRYKSGQWSTLRITNIDANLVPGQLEVTGTLGSYVIQFGTRTIHKVVDGETITSKAKNPKAEGYRLYQNIADHLTKGEKLIITPEWARRPIHILDLADQSARKGVAMKAKHK
ncbi:MAG: gfo/Idh/MocA family oxidoreductase [Phycisphaera sp.]|nr:gfo/Idh/MocA family oxidoreductase [Phycisphaera sp.]